MKNSAFLSTNDAKYKNARASLLLIVILSAVNLVSVLVAKVYFLFSAYFPQLLLIIGNELYEGSGEMLFLIIMIVFALIMIVPYLLCWIFSKKHVGWMIGALVLFSLDSVVFLIDFVLLISAGDYTMIIDLVIRIWAIVSLALGVKYGMKAKKEVAAEGDPNAVDVDAMFGEDVAFAPDIQRNITVSRKKAFTAMAVQIVCYVNGKDVCTLKNGETKSFPAPTGEFELGVMFASGVSSSGIKVPAGTSDAAFSVSLKMKMTTTEIVITPINSPNGNSGTETF